MYLIQPGLVVTFTAVLLQSYQDDLQTWRLVSGYASYAFRQDLLVLKRRLEKAIEELMG